MAANASGHPCHKISRGADIRQSAASGFVAAPIAVSWRCRRKRWLMKAYFEQRAAYNRWANARLYEAALSLSDADYRRDVGAFFKSMHGTLNHLLLTDRLWLKRLTGEGGTKVLEQEGNALEGSVRELTAGRLQSFLEEWMNHRVDLAVGCAGRKVSRRWRERGEYVAGSSAVASLEGSRRIVARRHVSPRLRWRGTDPRF